MEHFKSLMYFLLASIIALAVISLIPEDLERNVLTGFVAALDIAFVIGWALFKLKG
ncbi:MAG: hypothetical protein WC333_05450 [Dehalococcoidia bacterium]|jgi:hypothetical protein